MGIIEGEIRFSSKGGTAVMLKRIVVGLDGSSYSESAVTYACSLAKKCDAALLGVGVVDLPEIEKHIGPGGPPGSGIYAKRLKDTKIEDALSKVKGFLGAFEERCKSEGVKCEFYSDEGAPFEAILEAGKTADLIIVGLRTYYHFETSSEPGDTLKRLLEKPVCPVMAVPEERVIPENVVIAFDGGYTSARAMRSFVHLSRELSFASKVTLLRVTEDNENEEVCTTEMSMAKRYLETHGISVDVVCKSGRPSQVILGTAKALRPSMVVMGSFGKGTITKFIFGSTASEVIEDASLPLFVYH
jgi:nucleotide-binding universal stress UspA family protein